MALLFENQTRDSMLEISGLLFVKYHYAAEIDKLKDRARKFAEIKKSTTFYFDNFNERPKGRCESDY